MIEVRGLTKRYGPTVAVDGLTFEVKPSTVTGFLGPNGSGKSTTMRMIIGLDEPDAGQAWIGGRCSKPSRSTRASQPAPTWPHWPPATAWPSAGSTRCWTSSA